MSLEVYLVSSDSLSVNQFPIPMRGNEDFGRGMSIRFPIEG